ncbi:MAG: ribonuclease HI [Cyclobacteriaceae bacterium]
MVNIFTDGSSLGNPGPGGYGIVLTFGQHRREISQGFTKTTNNRMELMAVIVGLESLTREGQKVTVYSDSKYVVDTVDKGWLWSWVKKGFKGKKNPDLWQRFIPAYKKHDVKFKWIKGHAGHPENERCDRLAVAAANSGDFLVDEGFGLV